MKKKEIKLRNKLIDILDWFALTHTYIETDKGETEFTEKHIEEMTDAIKDAIEIIEKK